MAELAWLRLAASGLLSAAVALAARAAGALSAWGAVAATGVGALVLAGGGLPGGAALLFFFLTGSALTALRRRRQGRPRTGREARQVLANGLPAACAGLAQLAWGPTEAWQSLLAGSLAAMCADTWATEVGLLTRAPARRVVDGRPVPPGTSGGVSLPGTAAGALAASLVALVAARVPAGNVGWGFPAAPPTPAAVAVGGLVGLVLDSVLGACVQARYRCLACGALTESPRAHRARCGAPRLLRVGGLPGVNNDVVNAAAAWAGGLTAALWAAWSGGAG